MKKMNIADQPLWYKIMVGLNVISLFLVGVLVYAMSPFVTALTEKAWLSYPGQPFPLEEDRAYYPGETISFVAWRCNSSDTEHNYVFSHRMVGGPPGTLDQLIPTLTPPPPTSVQPGCFRSATRLNTVPDGTKPGTYHFEGVATINGQIRSWDIPWRTADFQVKAREPKP